MNNSISFDFYKGSDGPTIRIATHTVDSLKRIKEDIIRLKNGEIEEIRCSDWGNVIITGFSDLVLRLRKRERHWLSVEIETKVDQNSSPIYIWEMGSIDWYNCEGLIDGLINGSGSGHQYLIETNMTIILCYNDD